MRVVGLVFADTLVSNRVSVQRMARTVLIGSGEDSLPQLPIDISGLNMKYFSPVCPAGFMSYLNNTVKILLQPVEIKNPLEITQELGLNSTNVNMTKGYTHFMNYSI